MTAPGPTQTFCTRSEFLQCIKAPLPSVTRGLDEDVAADLGSADALERAAEMPASQWCSVLRNALAHGGIAYLNENGRSTYNEPVKMFAFASGKYINKHELAAVNLLRISEADYFDFLRNWVAWLQKTGIQDALAA